MRRPLHNRPGAVRLAVALFFAALSLCPPARAWDKGTADALAGAAVTSLSGEIGAFLEREKPFFTQGWEAGEETLARYAGFATYDSAGYAAGKLDSQITLLRELFPHERTPYMAYRLGILARLVADLNSPFATAASPQELKLRGQFMRDVEAHRAALRGAPQPPRVLRNPGAAVAAAVKRASGWAGPVRAQYLSGRGYNVIAQQAAATFYRASAQMVPDVLFTVGSGGGGTAELAARYGYHDDACEYYLRRGMAQDALAAYNRVADMAPAIQAGRMVSLQDAVEKYSLNLHILSLEENLRNAGISPERKAGEQLMASFLSGLARFAVRSLDARREEDSRFALSLCLREGYLPDRTLQNCRRLYGLEGLKNLDVPGNARKIYREANSLEAAAGKACDAGKFWAANDSFLHAAALYSAIPESVRELNRASNARIGQIRRAMQSLPLNALLSEDLFHAAVDSLAAVNVDAAVRDLQLIQNWKPGDADVRATIGDAEALQLFTQGKKFVGRGDYTRAAEQFRRLVQRYPASPLSAPAREMLKLYEKMHAESSGKLLTLLRAAYEASFVGDKDTVYQLCDQILASHPADDLRDRAQLLIAVAWYESNGKGYQKIDRIFRDLLKQQVIEQDGDELVLKKSIDFYFGLADPFPKMKLSEFTESVLEKLGPNGAGVVSSEDRADADKELGRTRDDSQETLDDADAKIERAEDTISEIENNRDTELQEQRSELDDARGAQSEAKSLFEDGDYERAKEKAEEAADDSERITDQME
jgi:hypothetical protein